MSIGRSFGDVAAQYDSQRRKFVPCFDDLYQVPLKMLQITAERPRILDIGAGTGIFAAAALEKYPHAEVTLIDLSDEMLNEAQKRFGEGQEVKYIVGDYTEYPFAGKFDAIISALSIHHLPAGKKEKLYARCYGLLNTGGALINADIILARDRGIEEIYMQLARENWENSGLTKEEIQAGYERMQYDDPSTLEDQLDWLRQAGFRHVDCIYKYLSMGVMYAIK